MAAKNTEPVELKTIEQFKTELATPEHIYAGVCSNMNWRAGKMVSKNEYVKAVELFLNRPMGGSNNA